MWLLHNRRAHSDPNREMVPKPKIEVEHAEEKELLLGVLLVPKDYVEATIFCKHELYLPSRDLHLLYVFMLIANTYYIVR